MERFRPAGREGGAERESQWREKGILKSQGDRLKDGIYDCKECHRLCIFSIYTTLHSYTWYLQALGNRLQYCIYKRKWVDWDNLFNSWVQNRKGKKAPEALKTWRKVSANVMCLQVLCRLASSESTFMPSQIFWVPWQWDLTSWVMMYIDRRQRKKCMDSLRWNDMLMYNVQHDVRIGSWK